MKNLEEVMNLLSACESEEEVVKLLSCKEMQAPIVDFFKNNPNKDYLLIGDEDED